MFLWWNKIMWANVLFYWYRRMLFFKPLNYLEMDQFGNKEKGVNFFLLLVFWSSLSICAYFIIKSLGQVINTIPYLLNIQFLKKLHTPIAVNNSNEKKVTGQNVSIKRLAGKCIHGQNYDIHQIENSRNFFRKYFPTGLEDQSTRNTGHQSLSRNGSKSYVKHFWPLGRR